MWRVSRSVFQLSCKEMGLKPDDDTCLNKNVMDAFSVSCQDAL